MADELDPVVQKFEADISEYVAKVQEAAGQAQEFAAASEETKAALDSVRDKAIEAAEATGIYRDSMGRLHAANGQFIKQSAAVSLIMGHLRDEALEEATALGHLRDEALLAAVGMRELKKEERGAADAGLLARLGGGLGGLFSKAGGAIPMGSGWLSLPAMIAIIPIVEALLPLVAGLLAGFAAAGAGAGAFALLAIPAIKSVSGAYQQIHADQQAYNRALTATAKNTALKHLQADYAALSEPQRDALSGIQQLSGEWHKMSTAFTPEALKVLGGVLKLAAELLPTVTPFAKTFADSLSGLLGKASGFAGSKGFADWLKQFHALEGPSITAIGNGIGQVAGAIGKLLTVMSQKDVVNAINIAFGILTGTINVITGMVKRLMDNWDGMSVAAKHTAYDIRQWSHDVAQAFDTVRHFAAILGHDTAAWFDFIRHHAADLAHNIAAHFDEIRHDLARWADDVRHYADVVVHWFEQLPGRIMHGLGDLGHLLWNAGVSILKGLLGGLIQKYDDVKKFVGGIAGWISSHKGPIAADSVLLQPHGIAIMQGLISGLKVGMGTTMAYVTGMARALSQQVEAGLAAGLITSSQAAAFENSITRRLGADATKIAQAAEKLSLAFNDALTRSLSGATSASAAKSAVAKLATMVKSAWTAGLIGNDAEAGITNWLDAQSVKLQALAGQRQKIAAEIAQARQFAASTASATAGNYAISGFATSGPLGGAAPVSSIIGSLRADVSQIRKFKTNILKLAKEGLNKAYLGQLIGLGPVQGGALAQELADANLGDIKSINSLESTISHVSGQLGKQAANEMYDTGKDAGRGFLSGLEAQKAAITALMQSIARSMIATLKKELGISSPSTVMRWHMHMTGEGIIQGLLDMLGRIKATAALVAAAAVPGGSRGLSAAAAGGYAGGGTSVHATVNMTVQGSAGPAYADPAFRQYLQREVQEATLRYGQLNPGNGLTPAWGH